MIDQSSVKTIQTPVLNIGYGDHGDSAGFPVILLHGFPYDVRSFDARELRSRIRLSAGDPLGAYADLCEAARLYPLHDGYAAARDRLRESLRAASGGTVR